MFELFFWQSSRKTNNAEMNAQRSAFSRRGAQTNKRKRQNLVYDFEIGKKTQVRTIYGQFNSSSPFEHRSDTKFDLTLHLDR